MRRFLTFVITAISTALGTLYWLHDGDLAQAVEPVLAEWNAELLAQDAGLADEPSPAAPEPVEPSVDR
jgi:hypothetical protein